MGCEKHCTVQQYSRVRICSNLFSTFIVLLLLKKALINYSECRESSIQGHFSKTGSLEDKYMIATWITQLLFWQGRNSKNCLGLSKTHSCASWPERKLGNSQNCARRLAINECREPAAVQVLGHVTLSWRPDNMSGQQLAKRCEKRLRWSEKETHRAEGAVSGFRR